MIKAQVVADSLSPQGDRLTSFLITFPRIVLAEAKTHRILSQLGDEVEIIEKTDCSINAATDLSKNTASSRAIPFNKMVETIRENPFIPIAWQKEHKGMQGTEYFTNESDIKRLNEHHLISRDMAIQCALNQNSLGATKQICNRYLEPFMWTTMLITGSKEGWDNFFELRCPDYVFHDDECRYDTHNEEGEYHFRSKKEVISFFGEDEPVEFSTGDIVFKDLTNLDWLKLNRGQAEIHMMALAEAIYDAMNESTPKQLKANEWHIPFIDKMDLGNPIFYTHNAENPDRFINTELLVKVSTAMAARTSYTVVGDEKEVDYKKMIELHDRLINQNPLHASPMEHCARAMSDGEYASYFKGVKEVSTEEGEWYNELTQVNLSDKEQGWCRNFKGFIMYRHILETKQHE